MVKQEMVRINNDILGISELKWLGMGELNSNSHYIYYCGQESHRRHKVTLIINKSLKHSIWVQPKNERMISVCFQGKPFNITVIKVYVPTTKVEKAEVDQFCEDLEDLLELTPRKDVLFIIGDWNCKSRKSRYTWRNKQVCPWRTI